jgi:ABC-type lipopolysaccharide export system ATPase subunit
LEDFRLTRLLDRLPAEMQQSDQLFLALAQAYLQNPLFLMIDEPFPGLSGPDLQHCLAILHRFRDRGTGILVTDHNPRVILEIADTVSILSNGVIAYSDGTREVVNA